MKTPTHKMLASAGIAVQTPFLDIKGSVRLKRAARSPYSQQNQNQRLLMDTKCNTY